MTDSPRSVGARGEDFATHYLEKAGLTILERNWRCPAGEADIIAQDEDALVFIEVKTRQNIAAGFPEDSVNRGKRRRYEMIAAYYLSQSNSVSTQVRFDIIAILLTGAGQAFLKHHHDVFGVGE
ncbi:MAG: YraN family protein [Actinomycetia bacterium]|nr:YraN family protein [Actinomycetes bacterium]